MRSKRFHNLLTDSTRRLKIVDIMKIKYGTFAVFGALLLLAGLLAAQTGVPKTHRLEATPATVAYGYYWSEAKPVLRIASGDIIDVDTLLTSNPMALARAGVADNKIQE